MVALVVVDFDELASNIPGILTIAIVLILPFLLAIVAYQILRSIHWILYGSPVRALLTVGTAGGFLIAYFTGTLAWGWIVAAALAGLAVTKAILHGFINRTPCPSCGGSKGGYVTHEYGNNGDYFHEFVECDRCGGIGYL
ncbi:hypothetical protein O7608_18375 [Solwaraspora sp. WMMA2056]|uniref:hypothetical protein n=1 Tax=Solwaraspora sp. WMMA2056 TaxID=3015161 RepID=UPI00259BC0F8|nr:hypothetical protein [Solwaraspora sp. WMMA2056]WJK38468.1 hypothetical protein O7608_18375 [Solwaraspora sp. WMMA2056]